MVYPWGKNVLFLICPVFNNSVLERTGEGTRSTQGEQSARRMEAGIKPSSLEVQEKHFKPLSQCTPQYSINSQNNQIKNPK